MIPRNGESSDLKEKRKCGKNVKVQFLTGPLEHPISFIHTPLMEFLVLYLLGSLSLSLAQDYDTCAVS